MKFAARGVARATIGAMTFLADIGALYRQHGPNHILPFIGGSYHERSTTALRVAVVGINAYATKAELRRGNIEDGVGNAKAWQNAGLQKPHGETYRFHETAYREVTALAEPLVIGSKLFSGLVYDANPETKSGLYATNAVKVFTTEAFKKSDAIPAELIWGYAPTWHRELDTMAAHGALPHLVIILGDCLWEPAWRAFNFYVEATFPSYGKFRVLEFEGAPRRSPVEHHANRIRVMGRVEQDMLLVRLHHPSGRAKVKRDAAWLLKQRSFRTLAQMA